MGAEYARMANQFARAVSQRALCITDKIIISLIQPCFQGGKVECRSDGGIEQDFSLSQLCEFFFMKQNHILIQTGKDHLAAGQKFL